MPTIILQNTDLAISVMQDAGRWIEENGKPLSRWWKSENLNRDFLLRYANPEEFYVVMIDNVPAAAVVLQFSQSAQNWQSIDGDNPKPALYMHWFCVHRNFRGQGLPKVMIDFAEKLAKEKDVGLLRVDTNAEEMKLRDMYEAMDFSLAGIVDEKQRKSALYEKKIVKQGSE